MEKFTITRKYKKELKREFRKGMGVKKGFAVMRDHGNNPAVRQCKNAFQ